MTELNTNTELINSLYKYKIDLVLKIKLIFFILIKSHIYSDFSEKLNFNFINSLHDIHKTNDNLKKYILKTHLEKKDSVKEQSDKGIELLTSVLFDDITTNEINKNHEQLIINILIENFLSYDHDFNHPFIPDIAIQNLSPNVKFIVTQFLLSHTQLLHDKTKSYNKSILMLINDNVKTLDELLEFAIFQANYSQFSSIGYMCNMKYSDNDPYDVFNKKSDIDKIVKEYNIISMPFSIYSFSI